jgi:hypothetical protein
VTSGQQRRGRVERGSRRKRDLEASQLDLDAYASQHFGDWPEQFHGYVKIAAFAVYMRHHKRQFPDPAEVKARLEEIGRTPELLEAELEASR